MGDLGAGGRHPGQGHVDRREALQMLCQGHGHLRVERNIPELASLRWCEDERAADLLHLLPDVEPAEVPDVVDRETEDLLLTKATTAPDVGHRLVSLRETGPHGEDL